MAMGPAAGSTADNVPMQLFFSVSPPPDRLWQFQPVA